MKFQDCGLELNAKENDCFLKPLKVFLQTIMAIENLLVCLKKHNNLFYPLNICGLAILDDFISYCYKHNYPAY